MTFAELPPPQLRPYSAMVIAGLVVSLSFWAWRSRGDRRMLVVYAAGVVGAFAGAKVVYLLAEGWMFLGREDTVLILATGKTVLGAMLGGYAGVEWGKSIIGYRKATGDDFALIVPLGIAVGRVGCLMHGCCPGRACSPAWYALSDGQGLSRWPAVPVEIGFNLLALAVLLPLRRSGRMQGQHFHLYLMAYGLFRFAHEFARDTPKIWWGMSGYHVAALAVFALGMLRFRQRANQAAKR